jgi:poly(beta-D-mannuronate) lyase
MGADRAGEEDTLPRISVLLPLLVLAACSASAATLRSPWDDRKVEETAAPYKCPAPPPFARTLEIESYYVDSHASIADPVKFAAFQKASRDVTQLSQIAAMAADAYLYKGSREAAACVYTLLDAAAKAQAWAGQMPGFQGVYEQNWLLSAVAVSYLKVRSSGLGTPESEARILWWLKQLSLRVREYFDAEVVRIGPGKENNHLYWAGLSVAASGIANDDPAAFKWGVVAYRMGLDAIQPDGSLPQEMNRAAKALHYHLYALGPLVMLAELGEANSLDLYSEEHGALHRLVAFCLAGLEDPTLLQKRTGIAQEVTLPYAGSDIGWAVPYVRRFPNAQLSELLAKAPWVRFTAWGGAPPE